MAQDDIQGQVVDAQGNPVEGAIVELTKSYQSSPVDEQVVRRTTTDANGNYIFEFHPDGDGTTQEWHVSCYNHDGTAYVNSFNNPGVTADLPSNAIPDSALTQDLVAWYRFEDGDARDYTATLDAAFADSTAYDGTVNGATYQSTGGVTDFNIGANSGAFDFDGTDDDISVPDYGIFGGGQSVTVLAWVNQDQLTGDRGHVFSAESESIFELRNKTGTNEFSINFSSGRVTLTGGSPPYGNWQHWACVYDASNGMEYYLDANLQDSDGKTDSIGSFNASSNHIGAQLADGRFLDGRIDDVRIYNAALTAAEISDIYNATKP